MPVRYGREQDKAVWTSPARTLRFRCCHLRDPVSRSSQMDRMELCFPAGSPMQVGGRGNMSEFREPNERKTTKQTVP